MEGHLAFDLPPPPFILPPDVLPPASSRCRAYIASNMKTTIDIADALLNQARDTAAREGTTVRALVEEGLREVLARHRKRRARFELRDASFGGDGLQPGVDVSDWASISGETYGGRGA